MNPSMKGIILAGGQGTRLYPATMSLSKHLLPVHDKPMIYYSLVNMMLAGIKDILIVTSPKDQPQFYDLLKDGSQWGISISYADQPKPKGIADGLIIGERFINGDNVCLHLADNIYYGHDFVPILRRNVDLVSGATVLVYQVKNPKRYGVIEFDKNLKAVSIQEKPKHPKSNYVVTGIYFYDSLVVDVAKSVKPSKRGELEITSVNNVYLGKNQLRADILGRGVAWLDAGTPSSLLNTSNFIATLEERQGLRIGCPEEAAWRMEFISDEQIEKIASECISSEYSEYLLNLLASPETKLLTY